MRGFREMNEARMRGFGGFGGFRPPFGPQAHGHGHRRGRRGGGRKRFTLTEAGQTEATAAAADAPWNEFSEETVNTGQDTKEAIFGIMNALRQIGFEGTPEQWQQAVAVLTETKRKLYGILADSD